MTCGNRGMLLHLKSANITILYVTHVTGHNTTSIKKISFHHFIEPIDFTLQNGNTFFMYLTTAAKFYSGKKHKSHSYTFQRERGHSPPVYV